MNPNIVIDLEGVTKREFIQHVQKHSIYHIEKHDIAIDAKGNNYMLVFWYDCDDLICGIKGYLPTTESEYSIVKVEAKD